MPASIMSDRAGAVGAGSARTHRVAIVAVVLAALGLSAIHPYDWNTWVLEVFPVLIGLPLAIALHRRFPLSLLVSWLLAGHAVILVVGGHYSYARVPLGFWLEKTLHLSRNPYDRIGHFAQGFVPAILTREILLRCTPLRRGAWLAFITVSICLAFSASYELFEWATAVVQGAAANDFLGTQGDPWDTQWDMFTALIGAIVATGFLSRLHDRFIFADASRFQYPPGEE